MEYLKQLKSKFFLVLFAIYYLLFTIATASAQTMSNDNYILQLNEINTTQTKPTVKNNTLGVTSEPPYKVESKAFTFSISQTLIDLSTLSPNSPILRNDYLTISNESPIGYSINASEDKELSATNSSAVIPDTTCDNGLCSETRSALWSNPLTYGFGYRCDNTIGKDCVNDFSDLNFYKQFANNSLSEIPKIVASGTFTGKSKKVQITYKINIPLSQPFAFYSNTITFIAIPNF